MTLLTEAECLLLISKLRWNGVVTSPFDLRSKVYHCADSKYKCKSTGKYFTAKTGTLFAGTRINLPTWFLAIQHIIEKPDVTSISLAAAIGVTQKTAWLMQKKIRPYLKSNNSQPVLQDKLGMLDWLRLLKDNEK